MAIIWSQALMVTFSAGHPIDPITVLAFDHAKRLPSRLLDHPPGLSAA